MELGSLYYDLDLNDNKLKGQIASADSAVKSLGKNVSQYWGASVKSSRAFMLGLTGAAVAVGAFGKSAYEAYKESAMVGAQTNAVITSTGGVAKVTASEVARMAKQLEFSSMFTDEQVQSGENMLLTFTKIGRDVFPLATQTIVDMSQALGQDMKGSAIQLGKALSDPIRGVTALRKVGVTFTEAQQKQIKTLVDSGRLLDAQKIILKELQTEFGGSARAALAAAGPFAILGKLWDDLKETVGGLITQAITPLVQWLGFMFNRLGGAQGIIDKVSASFARLKPWLPAIAGAILGGLVPALVALALSFGQFLIVLAPWMVLGAALVYIWVRHRDWIYRVRDAFLAVGNYLAKIFIPVFRILKSVFDFLFPSVVAIFNSLRTQLFPALLQVWSAVRRLWAALNPALMVALKVIAIIIGVAVVVALKLLLVAINVVVRAFSATISIVSNLIKWLSNLISWVGNAAGAVVRHFGGLAGRISRAISGVYNVVVGPFRAAFNWIQGRIDDLLGAIARLKSAASSVINAPGNIAKKVGGFFSGIPGFATGGIVPGRVGAPTLAVVHGGEEVIPVGGKGSGSSIYIGQINNSADEDYLLRRMDFNQRLANRGGAQL